MLAAWTLEGLELRVFGVLDLGLQAQWGSAAGLATRRLGVSSSSLGLRPSGRETLMAPKTLKPIVPQDKPCTFEKFGRQAWV